MVGTGLVVLDQAQGGNPNHGWRYPSLVEGALSEVVVDIVEGLARKDMWSSLWSRVGEFVGRDEGTA